MSIITMIVLIVFVVYLACTIIEDSDSYGHHDSRPGSHYEISNRK